MKEFYIIGVGLCRTGTLSTKYALEIILHGKCHHMKDAKNFQEEWIQILSGKMSDEDFAAFFLSNDYIAGIDAPFSNCYKQASRAFPEAKVLLTIREPESWESSVINTVIKARKSYDTFPYAIFKWLGFPLDYLGYNRIHEHNKTFIEMIEAVDNNMGIEYYNNWIADVQVNVPEDKLLIFNVKEGWEPLCRFLDVPIPSFPYPNLNETKHFQERCRKKHHRAYLLCYEIVTLSVLVYRLFLHGKIFG